MRILGIDPGLTRCGVGVVDVDARRNPTFVFVHVIRTDSNLALPQRLLELETELADIFQRYAPESVAIERVFSQQNVRSAMDTASAIAVASLLCARQSIPMSTYTPTEVKAAVSGNGRADKAQVTTMVSRVLKLDTPPKPADAADALALALCHTWRGLGQMRLNDSFNKSVGALT